LGAQGNSYLAGGEWQASLAYRWLHSDRHFVGGVERPQRQADGSEVINDIHTFDLSLARAFTPRFSLSLTLPFVQADRSSLYEHDRTNRHHMQAGGLSDVRLVGTVWLLDPPTHPNGNFALGVGIKAPTGDYEATDYAFRTNGPTLRYVDSSIQPGDGGWGVILEAQGYQKMFKNAFAFVSAAYLINPREMVPNTGYSVWDSYLVRAGVSYGIWPSKGLSLSLSGRMEGVPVEDWFGGSEGFRRPGYAVSIEPGVAWRYRKLSVSVTAPVAIERNREKSVSDLRTGRHGDAAFADYIITGSIAYRF
jgi:hypothetical protein